MPLENWPNPVLRSLTNINKDIYVRMQGPSEFGVVGDAVLKEWDRKNDLKKGHKIKISDLTLKKPGTGINEKFMKNIINKKAKKNLSSQRILKRGDFE